MWRRETLNTLLNKTVWPLHMISQSSYNFVVLKAKSPYLWFPLFVYRRISSQMEKMMSWRRKLVSFMRELSSCQQRCILFEKGTINEKPNPILNAIKILLWASCLCERWLWNTQMLLWWCHAIDYVLSHNSVSFMTATGSHAINTNCSAAHSRQALSCKMAVEYDKFIESGKK